jgi:hypothetical protein
VLHRTTARTITATQEITMTATPTATLTAAQIHEAEMIRAIYDRADSNDGACCVAEVARGLCTQHEADAYVDNKEFDREAYLAIVFRTLRATRGY